jgi:hypothetical protein
MLTAAGLAVTSGQAHAQFAPMSFSSSAHTSSATYFMLPLNSGDAAAQPAPAKKAKPSLGSITTGWTYLYADEGAGERESINGWFLRPSFDVGKGYSVFFDSTNYYGTNRKGSLNGHGFTFGFGHNAFTLRHAKIGIFTEAGDVRSSNAGSIVNQFAYAAGFSVTVPIDKHVSLALTPAEYVFLYPKGDPRNLYNAKVGLSFPFGHR